MMPSFAQTIHRTALKRHTCTECQGDIQPMDIYERVTGYWDGQFSTFKTCTHCEIARDRYVEVWGRLRLPEEGHYSFGRVEEDITYAAPHFDGTGVAFELYRHVVGMRQRRRAAIARRAAEQDQH